MLEEAFAVGYESPLELQEQEINRIYNKFVKPEKMKTCDFHEEKLPNSAEVITARAKKAVQEAADFDDALWRYINGPDIHQEYEGVFT